MAARRSAAGRNGGVVLGAVAVAAAFFSIPFAAHYAKVRARLMATAR